MRRVLIATRTPYWRRAKGNQQRIFELVRYLAARNAVTVFYIGRETPGTDLGGARVVTTDAHRGLGGLAWTLFGRSLGSLRRSRLLRAFGAVCRSGHWDAVIIEYIWHAYLVGAVENGQSLTLLDAHDIVHRRVEDFARFGRVPDRTVTQDEEIATFRGFDYVLAIQREEFAWLNRVLPGRAILAMHPVEPVNGLYVSRLARVSPGGKLTLVYFASLGDANLDAIRWFLSTVWNVKLASAFQLHVYGGICDSLPLRAPGVLMRGLVTSIADVYRDADIAINPTRFGSGLKIKTVEALAHGVPLVTTHAGAEGLGPGAAGCLLRAGNAGAFRDQLERLRDPDLRRELSANALAFVARDLSPSVCFGELQALIDA
jgi:glycosyltransferase involved in cell wall biosynthesis